jgi:hypothetical protein
MSFPDRVLEKIVELVRHVLKGRIHGQKESTGTLYQPGMVQGVRDLRPFLPQAGGALRVF